MRINPVGSRNRMSIVCGKKKFEFRFHSALRPRCDSGLLRCLTFQVTKLAGCVVRSASVLENGSRIN